MEKVAAARKDAVTSFKATSAEFQKHLKIAIATRQRYDESVALFAAQKVLTDLLRTVVAEYDSAAQPGALPLSENATKQYAELLYFC